MYNLDVFSACVFSRCNRLLCTYDVTSNHFSTCIEPNLCPAKPTLALAIVAAEGALRRNYDRSVLEIMLVLGPHACSLSALLRVFSHSDREARRMFGPSGGEGVLTPKCLYRHVVLGIPVPSCTDFLICAWFKQWQV